MKKMILMIGLCVLVCGAAVAADDWNQVNADYKVYQVDRAVAKATFANGDYAKAYQMFLELADSAHCARRPAVKACQLNSAAYSMILMNTDDEGLISDDVAKKCLKILADAKKLSQSICGTAIDSNIAYCEERLE